MEVLNDIECYTIASIFSETNQNDSLFSGKILLDEDGWFEGMVNNPFNKKLGSSFVFGFYNQDSKIELIKIGDSKQTDPIIYVCSKDDHNFYDGEFMSLGTFSSDNFGKAKINTTKSSYFSINNKRNIEKEKLELKKEIAEFKKNNKVNSIYEKAVLDKTNIAYNIMFNNNKNESILLKKFDTRSNNKKVMLLTKKTMLEDDLK